LHVLFVFVTLLDHRIDGGTKALLLLREIFHHTLQASVITWTSACAACAASGVWQHALQIVRDPNELTFDAAIRSCAIAQNS